jgi:hypothetical protein
MTARNRTVRDAVVITTALLRRVNGHLFVSLTPPLSCTQRIRADYPASPSPDSSLLGINHAAAREKVGTMHYRRVCLVT